MTQDEAKKELLVQVERDLKEEVAKKIRQAEERIKIEASDNAPDPYLVLRILSRVWAAVTAPR